MQLNYTYKEREYKAEIIHPHVTNNILNGCLFITNSTFNLAHWLFAYSYLVLSYRLEQASKKLPQHKH